MDLPFYSHLKMARCARTHSAQSAMRHRSTGAGKREGSATAGRYVQAAAASRQGKALLAGAARVKDQLATQRGHARLVAMSEDHNASLAIETAKQLGTFDMAVSLKGVARRALQRRSSAQVLYTRRNVDG
jgi:hypothetical protein